MAALATIRGGTAKAAKAAKALGFPGSGWHRAHYLGLLNLLTRSVLQISKHLKNGAWPVSEATPRLFSLFGGASL